MAGSIDPNLVTVTKKFSCRPERLTSGLLHVQVKHEVQDQGGGGDLDVGELDVNAAYNKHWNPNTGGSTDQSPNNVPYAKNYPFVDADASSASWGSEPSYSESSDSAFRTTRQYIYSNAPLWDGSSYHSSGVSNSRGDKLLSLGDYDCMIFFVTCGMHLEAAYRPENTVYAVHNTVKYYSIPNSHSRCQSFVKSHLISRINNVRNSEHNYGGDDNLSMWKHGIPVSNFTNYGVDIGSPYTTAEGHGFVADSSNLGGTPTTASPYYNNWLITNGVYEYPGHGIDLTTGSTFFTPVYNVTVGTDHTQGTATDHTISGTDNPASDPTDEVWFDTSSQSHSITSFNLSVGVHLWAYDYDDDVNAYTKNRVNVMWQPFGETADLGVAT